MSGPAAAPPAARVGLNGWVEAILYNFVIALMSLAYVVAIRAGSHVLVFVFTSMTIGALGLLTVKGPGRDAREIALAPLSWAVGAAIIGMEVFFFLLLAVVPPADGSLLVRLSIPLSLLIGMLFLGRHVTRLGWLGGAMVTAGVGIMIARLTLPEQLGALLAALACAVIINLRSLATEHHPWNRRADTVPEKMRVTGIVVLVTALAGLALTAMATALVAAGLLPAMALVPTPAQLGHPATLLLAGAVGAAIYSALHYLGFSSVVKIGSENFIASAAFTPVMTLAVQTLAEATGLLHFPPFDWRLLPPMALAIGGVLVIVFAGRRVRATAPGRAAAGSIS